MTEHTNTPELRFPEFKDEWKLQKLGNLAQFSKGKSLSKKDLNINGKPCILYGELYTKYGAILNKVYSKTSTQNDSLVFSKRNQILIPSSGETDIDIATATAIDTDVKIAIGGDLNIITPINSDGRFISLYINGKGKYNLAKYAQGKSVVHLYNSDIKKLNFYLPTNMAEQKKIGDFFSKLDRQIELEEKKLELLEQQKRGYMQKIFSQELRFKDENGDEYLNWKTSQLGEITKTFSGGTPKSNNAGYYNGDIPFIRSGEISKQFTELKITENALNNSSAKLVEKGDLLYALYGATSGEVAISKINGAINQAVLCIKSKESISFLLNFLKLQKQHILKTYIQGGQGNLSASIVKGITIKLPCREEQTKIGNFLDKVEILIEKQSTKVELLKQRKQGLLQKMFV